MEAGLKDTSEGLVPVGLPQLRNSPAAASLKKWIGSYKVQNYLIPQSTAASASSFSAAALPPLLRRNSTALRALPRGRVIRRR
eukprot:139374-Amphidinium_carterae.1